MEGRVRKAPEQVDGPLWPHAERIVTDLEARCAVSPPLAPDASVRRSPCRLPWITKKKGSQRPLAGLRYSPGRALLPPLRPAPALDRDPDSPRSRRRPTPRRGAGATPPAWGTRTPGRAPALASH